MFSKTQRLSREEISEILEKKYEKRNSQNFFVKVSSVANGDIPKFSIIISKKVNKLAVKRHFIKRKIINLVQEILMDGDVENNSYIISVKKDVSNLDNETLKNELVKIIN